ncbi:MAG: GGDEF domain-containing protein [Treponema sp.]|nr:GGDEF domain-containing protein [Candidatus Treponema equifaecale]
MRRRNSIDPNTIKIASYAVTALLMLTVNFFCTKVVLKKSNAISVGQYLDSCERITDGYAETIEATLESYKAALNVMNFPNLYKVMDSEQIQAFLIEHKTKLKKEFRDIFYVDKNGIAYTEKGKIYDVSNREYYKQIIHKDKIEFISNEIRSLHDYSPIFVYAKAVYDVNGKKKGILCGSVHISTISDLIDEISINKEGAIIIQDMEGDFIAHPAQDWLGQVFNPSFLNLNLTTSSKQNIVNRIEASSTAGNPIYIFHKKIDGTTWTVGYCVPTSNLQHIEETQAFYQFLIICISFAATILIILIELWITNFFQKKQMISINFDSLTNLPTRERFEREANKLILHNQSSKFMLVESDIRGFKFLNQNHGERKADSILIQFSRNLNEITKHQHGLLCRGYADRFYSIYKITSVQTAMKAFTGFVDKINEEIKQSEIPYTPKFGLSFYLPKEDKGIVSVQHLIGQATFAKKSIKDNALKQYAIFDEKLSEKSNEDNYIELHMEQALKDGEFFVVYQPKIDLKTEKIAGAEALVRWENSKLGFMAPYKFIPLFEKNDFIIKLDFEVYRQVFRFLKYCIDEKIPIVPISVNMSRNHNKPEKFVHDFIALMKEYEIPPEFVEVELLERSEMDKSTLREVTLLLHKEGLTVAMDDFGSGESSLNMLSNIPVDVLKFDRSFLLGTDMKNAEIDEDKATFIETLVDLGKNLKKHTVFEGVETAEQRDFLKSINCDTVQGYFYSKPLKQDEYVDFVKSHV